jgi:hypothetical protein
MNRILNHRPVSRFRRAAYLRVFGEMLGDRISSRRPTRRFQGAAVWRWFPLWRIESWVRPERKVELSPADCGVGDVSSSPSICGQNEPRSKKTYTDLLIQIGN